MFSLARGLFSPDSAEDRSSLLIWFIDVGSERCACALASVRRSNCTDGCPLCSFHEDATLRDAREGINPTKFTSSYSPYSVALGSCVQPPLRQRLNRCDQIRRTDPSVELIEELSDVGSFLPWMSDAKNYSSVVPIRLLDRKNGGEKRREHRRKCKVAD
jgi:hypothetical protein